MAALNGLSWLVMLGVIISAVQIGFMARRLYSRRDKRDASNDVNACAIIAPMKGMNRFNTMINAVREMLSSSASLSVPSVARMIRSSGQLAR